MCGRTSYGKMTNPSVEEMDVFEINDDDFVCHCTVHVGQQYLKL